MVRDWRIAHYAIFGAIAAPLAAFALIGAVAFWAFDSRPIAFMLAAGWYFAERIYWSDPVDKALGVTYEAAPQEEPEAQPTPAEERLQQDAPPGWNAYPVTATNHIDSGRMWLEIGPRRVPVKLTRVQLAYLVDRISAGVVTVDYGLYGQGKPFTRANVDALRYDWMRKGLTERRGKSDGIKPEVQQAILNAAYKTGG